MSNPATGPLSDRGNPTVSRTAMEVSLGRLDAALIQLRQQTELLNLWPIATDFLRQIPGLDLIWIATYNRQEQILQGHGGYTQLGSGNFLKQRFILAPGSLLDQVIMQKQAIAVPDLRTETRAGEWSRAAQKLKIQGSLFLPMLSETECLGVVLVGSHLWGEIQRGEERSVLSIFLTGLGQNIQRINLATARATSNKAKATIPPGGVTAKGTMPGAVVEDPGLESVTVSDILAQVTRSGNFTQRLDALLQTVHQALLPARTSLFTFQAEANHFLRRRTTTDNPSPRENERLSVTIAAHTIPGFCQALRSGQLVAISDAHSFVGAQSPMPLLQLLKATAILAVPVRVEEQLWGFLIVDVPQSRIWTEADRQFMRAAGQFLSLFAPVEVAETKYEIAEQARTLASGLTQAICSDQDWQATLKHGAEDLAGYLQAQALLILRHDQDTRRFEVLHQWPQPRGRAGLGELPPLTDLDWRSFQQKPGPQAITNIEQDLRLIPWHQDLLSLKCPDWLVVPTTAGPAPDSFLVIGRNNGLPWLPSDQDVAQGIARQLGVLTHQWQLQHQASQQQHLYNSLRTGLAAIQKTQNLERLEVASVQTLLELFQAPLAALITWNPGETQAWIVGPPPGQPKFSIRSDLTIDITSDPLIQAALHISQADQSEFLNHPNPYPEIIQLRDAEISPITRQWLDGPEIGYVIAMALRTDPEYQPSGVVIVADQRSRIWPPVYLEAFITLVNHLAYCHRSIALSTHLIQGWQQLETLNWYKHRRMEGLYRQLGSTYQQLYQGITGSPAATPTQLGRIGQQFQSQLSTLIPLLQQEAWQLQPAHANVESLGLSTLLKRSLDRIESLVKQKQLWTQVHNPEMLSVTGDINKFDLILQELLVGAAQRTPDRGRIDVWCQAIDTQWLEISITDDGYIEPRLLIDLHHRDHLDWLAPSTLDQPPGRHLRACYAMAQQLGATLDLYKLEDGRVLSRLILPLHPIVP